MIPWNVDEQVQRNVSYKFEYVRVARIDFFLFVLPLFVCVIASPKACSDQGIAARVMNSNNNVQEN